jgi:hypothetical protein
MIPSVSLARLPSSGREQPMRAQAGGGDSEPTYSEAAKAQTGTKVACCPVGAMQTPFPKSDLVSRAKSGRSQHWAQAEGCWCQPVEQTHLHGPFGENRRNEVIATVVCDKVN